MADKSKSQTKHRFSPQRVATGAKRRWQKLQIKYADSPHRSFRLTPRVKRRYSLAGVREGWELIADSVGFMRTYKKMLLGFVLLYGVFSYLLIGGVSQATFVALKEGATETFDGALDATSAALGLYGSALTGGLQEPPSDVQQLMTAALVIIFWLAILWAVRMTLAGNKIKLRDAFYNGMTPFVSTLLVLLVLSLQLLPGAAGIFLFVTANQDGWLYGGVETMAFGTAAGLLTLLSAYWITGTLVALAIVALPGVYPMYALASARQLVSGKRWRILMRILIMALIVVLAWGMVLIPTFLLDAWLRFDWLPLVPVMVQLLQATSLVFGVIYTYKLYRSLL